MGVLIFTLAFLPKVGGRTQVLVQAEATGPVSNKLVPKTALSARILYLIYISLTLLEILALCLAGMPFYDAVVNTFATVCTGGFSVRNLSIASYGLPACEVIITVFMLLCSLNFAVFFLVLTGRLRQALGSDELRFFLLAVALSSAIVFSTSFPCMNPPAMPCGTPYFRCPQWSPPQAFPRRTSPSGPPSPSLSWCC